PDRVRPLPARDARGPVPVGRVRPPMRSSGDADCDGRRYLSADSTDSRGRAGRSARGAPTGTARVPGWMQAVRANHDRRVERHRVGTAWVVDGVWRLGLPDGPETHGIPSRFT